MARLAAMRTTNQLLFRGDSTGSRVNASGVRGPAKWFVLLRCGGWVASRFPQSVWGPVHVSLARRMGLPPQLRERHAYPRFANVMALLSEADWPPPWMSRMAGRLVPPFG
ncbi:MAG: hypothetical protein RIS92_2866 [Verrucomicrobiota bacterium]